MMRTSLLDIAGESVTIRPIRAADVDMERDFVAALSPESRHFRFLGGVAQLSQQEAERLCDVDGTTSLALVATVQCGDKPVQIGVSRYSPGIGADRRELAVVVADAWQQRGLGAALVRELAVAAKENGIKELYSIAFANNRRMAALADDLAMWRTRDPGDASQIIYSLSL